MNKKSLVMLLTAATLGLGSCNDIQDLDVNFGDRTYINDYKGLIDAVNDLNLSLKERMNALSQLLKEGIADIKLSIDANTGAITIVGQNVATLDGNMKDGLSTINTSLFNGFQSVCTQIDNTGKTFVAAIDDNGNLLRLQIDNTGKLLSTQMITSTQELTSVMKENNTSLAEKLGLIDAAIKAGFTSTEQGQTGLKEALKEAINALTAEVKAGNKSNADALAEVKNAVTSLTTSLETKLAAIETANKEGLATLAQKNDLISAAISALKDEVKAGNKSNEDALKEIKAAVASQTTSLAEKIALVQSAVATGFANENTTLTSMTSDLKTAIDNLKTEVQTGNTNNATYLSQMVSGLTALNTTMGTTNTQLGNIKDVLTKELADNGVTINPDGDGKSILVTPDIWNDIEKAGPTSNLYNTFLDAIKDVTLPKVIDPIQVTPASAGRWHTCASFINDGYDESSVALRAGTLQPMTAANGKTVIKVIKTPSEVKFHIEGLWRNGSAWCTYPYIYNIRVFDARGDYQVYGGENGNEIGNRATIGEETSRAVPTTKVYTATIILKAYYNGRICDEVKAYVFTYNFEYASDLPSLFWPSTPDSRP